MTIPREATPQTSTMACSKAKCCILTVIALLFCLRTWITGLVGLIDNTNVENEWIKVDALIVGRNVTTISVLGLHKLNFCAQYEFTSYLGGNITAISDKDCALNALLIKVGSYVSIVYNPSDPEDFVEHDTLESELVSEKIMVCVGIPMSIILGRVLCLMLLNRSHRRQDGGLCGLLNRRHRRRPSLHSMDDSIELYEYIPRRTESRKETILAKLYTVTVLEDSSDILTSSTSSMSKLDSSSKTEEATGGTGAVHTKNEDKQCKESFLNSFIRPSHDAECSICLEQYQRGDVICASKKKECNHLFHKKCLMEWMMINNDRCPLCRVDFMKDDEDLEA